MSVEVATTVDATACPFCGCSGMLVVWESMTNFTIACQQCGAMGPVCVSVPEAIRLWNGRPAGGRVSAVIVPAGARSDDPEGGSSPGEGGGR